MVICALNKVKGMKHKMKKNNFENDIRILIIRENGDVDAIFSSNNEKCKNTIQIKNDNNSNIINKLLTFYKKIENTTYTKNDCLDRHLFYLKDFLNYNFIDEFKAININPQTINEDLFLYYLLTEMKNIIIISSNEHENLLITPINGISEEQNSKLNSICKLFSPNTLWNLLYEMHTEICEYDGKKYCTLNIGDSISGNSNNIISEYQIINSKNIHKKK